MAAHSSSSALASAVVSSSGARLPDDERQCTQSRLHAYVISQVRQIGAARPWRSTSYDDMDDPLPAQALEHGQQSGQRGLLELAARHQVIGDLAHGPGRVRLDERQQALVDEEELAVAIAVGQGAEPLGPQRDRVVQPDALTALHVKSAPPGTPGGARRVEPRDFAGTAGSAHPSGSEAEAV